jgi:hypothetical protein
MSQPFWITAYLDLAPAEHDEGVALWEQLTGYTRSPSRGPEQEYVSLVPATGDVYLGVQRLGTGTSRIHLDVHVTDPGETAREVTAIGATVVDDHGDYVVLESPGGFEFCLVSHPGGRRPDPTAWPDGHTSFVDQVCLDIPPSSYDEELDFWHRLTGWERKDPEEGSEFGRLNPPASFPVQLLLQRLDEDEERVRAHLDWSSTDREAETARHLAAGAQQGERFEGWTVMHGPAGMTYCVTAADTERTFRGGGAPG